METAQTLVSTRWLADHLGQNDNPCLILDCRATLGKPGQGRQEYLQNHIPGAVYADLDIDLAAPPDQRGRHPLPDREQWAHTLRQWGLNANQQVVTYDAAGGPFAARAWWMLRWAGHANVAVLDGGWPAWQRDHAELTEQSSPATTTGNFTLATALVDVATTDSLLQSLPGQTLTLVDARAEARWAGREEPIDPVAGHIPGALCLPFQDNLQDDGTFKSPQALAERFAPVLRHGKPVVNYCGSGVTAAHNALAMHIAGITTASVYPDSWSGWITDPERPIECC